MNEVLTEKHLAALRYPESREMYSRTLACCELRPGGTADTDQDMIYDLCSAEDMKRELLQDIRQRGVMVESRNGRQIYRKENPALARICRLDEFQRKVRADLGLAKRRKADDAEEEQEETDEFDSL